MLETESDISILLSEAMQNHGKLLKHGQELGPAFFDLRTRLAGGLFQKIMNYKMFLAVVITEPDQCDDRFRELMWEHRRHTNIRFFDDESAARTWLDLDHQN